MQTLGAPAGFLSGLVPTVVEQFGPAFPELKEKEAFVTAVIREEEDAFANLLEKGVKFFQEMVDDVKEQALKANHTSPMMISGDKAFFLYDTLGFPIDLTQIMAAEQGIAVDIAGFEAAMSLQKERSRQAAQAKRLAGRTPLSLGAEQVAYLQQVVRAPATLDHAKYKHVPQFPATIQALVLPSPHGFVSSAAESSALPTDSFSDWSIGIVLQETPFFSESGGQVADTGRLVLTQDAQSLVLDVVDVQSYGGYVLHTCVLAEETVAKMASMQVNLLNKSFL